MAIGPGSRIGPYEVTALLGEGGMGKVWRARHTGLKRDDALKVLPDAFASDPERLARFQREAQVLASLNHPHIAHVYGLEQSDGVQALVMELVEGPTLADRIAQGPIPVDEALPIARQIAEALEAAHEQGIIHRDLKPANIKLRADGTVKVLDFGLAKALEPAHALSPNASQSPTITSPALMTGVGVLLGTAAYMSPEQAKGRPADKRADIWAFGCVLFEMLTGKRAFEGEDVSDTLAAVLRGAPDWAALPLDVPPLIRALLQRCLQKDRKRRVADVSTALFAINEQAAVGANASATPSISVPRRSLWRHAIPVLVAAILTGALVGFAVWNVRPSTPPPTITRFAYALPEGQQFVDDRRPVQANYAQLLAISPDGEQMVYVANRRLYLRSLSALEARPLMGTEITQGAMGFPVFSPDGGSIAFWSGDGTTGAIRRIAVTGGVAVTICQSDLPQGMNWGTEGIVFGQGERIMRVSANGGEPEQLLSVENAVLWGPQLLPGGESVLYTLLVDATSRTFTAPGAISEEDLEVVVESLRSGERKTLIKGSAGRYLPSGHLVFTRGGTLFVVPFDLTRGEVTGGPVPAIEGVRRSVGPETYFSVSDTGSLIYIPGPVSTSSPQTRLVLIDQNGTVEPLKLRPGSYAFPRVSPDGKRVAVGTDDGKDANVWVYELSGASSMRQLTFGGKNRFPVWSADGLRIAFQSDREGDGGIFWQRADGTGTAERLTKPDQGTAHLPESWSPDGRQFLFSVINGSNLSLWTFSLQDKKAAAFGEVQSTFLVAATFSPDGRWVAYSPGTSPSDRSVFVQPFPATGARYRISSGVWPVWSPDGRELFFALQGQLQHAPVTLQPTVEFGNPEPVRAAASLSIPRVPVPLRQYDITPDGKRFLGVVSAEESQSGPAGAAEIQVVVNWFEELKGRVPTN